MYYEVVPWMQHRPVGKESGKTSYIERFGIAPKIGPIKYKKFKLSNYFVLPLQKPF